MQLNSKYDRTAFVFRQGTEADLPAVFELYRQRVEWMDKVGIQQWNATDYLHVYPETYYLDHIRNGRLFVAVYKDDPTSIAGAVVYLREDARWEDKAGENAFYVHNLVTALGAKGTGSFLIEETERLAQERGIEYVRLDCAVDNEFLNGYYEGKGYVPAGTCVDGAYSGNRKEKKIG